LDGHLTHHDSCLHDYIDGLIAPKLLRIPSLLIVERPLLKKKEKEKKESFPLTKESQEIRLDWVVESVVGIASRP